MKSQAPKFRDSVRGTASARLVLWADPIVRQVTSQSDFASGDLMCLSSPMSLYVQPPPADAARVRPLTRLMFHQMTRALMEHLNRDGTGRKKNHRSAAAARRVPDAPQDGVCHRRDYARWPATGSRP